MIFDLIRFVLVSRAQTSLFDARSDDGSVLSRDLWLRAVFTNKIDFFSPLATLRFSANEKR